MPRKKKTEQKMSSMGISSSMSTSPGGESLPVGNGSRAYHITRGEFDALAEKQKSDQNILLAVMAGIMIFVVVTFWIELSAMHRNYEMDKSILLQNNQLNKDYFEKVLFLSDQINELKLKIESSSE